MHVFDSSVWIYAVTRSCDRAVSLLDRLLAGRFRVAVDAYVFTEVLDGIERSGSSYRSIDTGQTQFAEIVYESPYIDEPSQRAIERLSLERIRTDDRTRMLGRLWDVQAKDVPIVILADNQPGDPTILHTSDRELSEFEPTDFGIDGIGVRYVDCSG